MKLLLIAAVLMACTSGCAVGSDNGFVSLFNGRDFSGWVPMANAAAFKVVDGCMTSDGGLGGDWIRTEKTYANFIFRLEWMLSKTGNSGLLIRHGTPGGGFEVQLLAPWTPYRDDLHCTGSMYGHVPANPRPDETTLRWRTAEVRCTYKHVEVYIDGVKCSEADYDKVETMKGFALSGYVGMQDSHTGPGEWVKFRNIQIKDLDSDPTFVAKGLVSSDAAVRRCAYDAAVALGASMAEPLLDMIKRGDPMHSHTAEMALDRIVCRASEPGAQAAVVRGVLLARVAAKGPSDRKDRVLAARLLGLVGQNAPDTLDALNGAVSEGGALGDAALEALKRIAATAASGK